jgi:hypothetical protein
MLTHRLAQCYCVLISIGVAAAFPHAQTPTPAERFEVASLKPYKGPPTMISGNVEPGGRFVALAYRVRESQIIGGPAWIGNDRFDLNAKANRELPPFSPTGEIGPLERMLQSLLADRFKFVAHRETRELPIFALVLAKATAGQVRSCAPRPRTARRCLRIALARVSPVQWWSETGRRVAWSCHPGRFGSAAGHYRN